jgi:SAM-dependent methyltransferase
MKTSVSKDEVRWAYRFFLGREPESEAVVDEKLARGDLPGLRRAFLSCDEFQDALAVSRGRGATMPLNVPAMAVETEGTREQLILSLRKIKAAWSHLGTAEPHFSVLTKPQYLSGHADPELSSFWESGTRDAWVLERILERQRMGSSLSGATCVEYGCGVGRVTMALAAKCGELHAYDISPTHLDFARARAAGLGLADVHFHESTDLLPEALHPCDLFYSRIVFQHNPPIVITELIRTALRSLRPGGVAVFQVPTYIRGYRFDAQTWIEADHAFEMQAHCLPQWKVFRLIEEGGGQLLEVREDDALGLPGSLSNVFVVRRKAASEATA